MTASPPSSAVERGRDLLVFSHANGFPAPTYRTLLAALDVQFDVSHVGRFGHDPRYPVSRGWPGLVRQLRDHIDALPPTRRVWLVGHSMGGYLSLLSAAQSGDRVAGIVLLDSPLIAGLTGQLIKLGRRTGLDRHLLPLRQTLQRRTHWPDVDAVTAHFAGKPGFVGWDAQVLRDYAEHATEGDPAGRRLWFDRDIEHLIYRTLPTRSVCCAAGRLQAPVAFVAGTQSREVRQIGLRATRRLVGARLQWVPGGHLFPMQRPVDTAEAIVSAIAGMDAAPGSPDARPPG
ncbi:MULTISPECIES: alpha/beta fold hydrolase [Luteimonas]|uniref:alpha/beta fold hydrolase n=1 Tax=Luteimonas TaxID=83614 RepID=UPI000C7AADC4|nr:MULTISPECIES: alpha/beta hydrolase [Luteimonas]